MGTSPVDQALEDEMSEITGSRSQTEWSKTLSISDLDRWLAVLGGVALIWFGLSRRSLGGLGLMASGGYLAYRNATGRNPVTDLQRMAAKNDLPHVEGMEPGHTPQRSAG
jgi:uncharacterized membrane protein